MAYTAEQKALALALVARHGGMTSEALADIEAALGKRVSTSTLHSWIPKPESKSETKEPKSESEREKKTPGALVTAEVQAQAEEALDMMFEAVARRYLTHATDDSVIANVKGKDAVIAAATAVDKMRLLRNLPTEIVQVLPAIMSLSDELGIPASDLFNNLFVELQAELQNAKRASHRPADDLSGEAGAG